MVSGRGATNGLSITWRRSWADTRATGESSHDRWEAGNGCIAAVNGYLRVDQQQLAAHDCAPLPDGGRVHVAPDPGDAPIGITVPTGVTTCT